MLRARRPPARIDRPRKSLLLAPNRSASGPPSHRLRVSGPGAPSRRAKVSGPGAPSRRVKISGPGARSRRVKGSGSGAPSRRGRVSAPGATSGPGFPRLKDRGRVSLPPSPVTLPGDPIPGLENRRPIAVRSPDNSLRGRSGATDLQGRARPRYRPSEMAQRSRKSAATSYPKNAPHPRRLRPSPNRRSGDSTECRACLFLGSFDTSKRCLGHRRARKIRSS